MPQWWGEPGTAPLTFSLFSHSARAKRNIWQQPILCVTTSWVNGGGWTKFNHSLPDPSNDFVYNHGLEPEGDSITVLQILSLLSTLHGRVNFPAPPMVVWTSGFLRAVGMYVDVASYQLQAEARSYQFPLPGEY